MSDRFTWSFSAGRTDQILNEERTDDDRRSFRITATT